MAHRLDSRWTPVWFLAPAVIALFAIGIFPTLYALWNSLHQVILPKIPREGTPFVGLGNYLSVLTDPTFWDALGRTLLFLVIVLPAELLLGLGVALLLHKPGLSLLKTLARLSLVIPMATTYAVVGLIGRLIFNRDFGVVNWFLGLVGIGPIEWLGDPGWAFVSIALMDIWQWTPFCALVLLAGLTMVPPEIEEAARLETKRFRHILRHVQLPFLLPGITAVLILRTADTLKLFDMIFTLTRGGPGAATELISITIQRIGFRVFDQGVASAQAILLLVLTIVLSRMYIRLVYQEVE
ncbi:carbohydrate ABC transporter permease [Inquilinus limosus]|uniref:Sugar ABC transporter permease n=1 Tax=Inquilinus limosus MP06 TaxID=1398085 RepID=A0A0A0D843_9PROT|nr:sugar ABC transporter permease [Inquilinus limosus]KGM34008.1 sugar ABC transporter permease [Inquilinus limosus MP06]